MKKQADMKKKQTAAKGAAAISAKDFISAIDEASGDNTGKRKLWKRLMEVLPRLGEATAEGDTASERPKAADNPALERARRFLDGKCTKRELNAIGVESVYKILLRLYAELNTANTLYDFYERFSAWEHLDLRAVLEARKQRESVRVCGEGVDVALKLWELEDHLSLARDDEEREATKQKIDEYKTRLRELGEEVYETLKRAERKAADKGADALKLFKATKDAALLLGAPDMTKIQRQKAAKYLKDTLEKEGVMKSVIDAANYVDVENNKGGYATTASLITALNRKAAELGIEKFINRHDTGEANPSA